MFLNLGLLSGNGVRVRKLSPGGSLGTITGAAVSTEYTTRKYKLISGTDLVITAQAGSTYSINGGEYTSEAGTISAGDILRVKHTSSANYEDAVTGGVVVNSLDCDFIIETMADPTSAGIYQDGDTIIFQDGDRLIFQRMI